MPFFNSGKQHALAALAGTAPGTLRCLLVAGYTFDADHDRVADLSAQEIATVDNYSRIDLPAATATADNVNDRGDLDFANLDFGSIGGTTDATPSHVIIFDDTGASDADRVLVAALAINPTVATSGGPFVINTADVDGPLRLA